MSGKALFIVRAEVPDDADRHPFDDWYRTQHFPQALSAVHPERAWRCWSIIEPAVHYAFYEFRDVATGESAFRSDAIKAMIVEFDRAWGSKVTRTRDIAEMVQETSVLP